MKAAEILNATQLARFARITAPVAYRLLEGREIERVDVAVLEALCAAFDCQPGDLLAYVPEREKGKR